MKPKSFMLIAGEASGDLLAAELVTALRLRHPVANYFGAGGARMSSAGVELIHDMSRLAVVGITDVVLKLVELHRLMKQLLATAIERQPDVIIGVDYGGFNLRFGHAVKEYLRDNPFSQWQPKIVQFVSPQVWASRPGRAQRLAEDYDLLLSIFPFEKAWYAQRAPRLRVEFVGHPMVERFAPDALRSAHPDLAAPQPLKAPSIVLLPGSRKSELKRHLPPMLGALALIQAQFPEARAKMVLPDLALKHELDRILISLAPSAAVPREVIALPSTVSPPAPTANDLPYLLPGNLQLQIGKLPEALAQADIAIAKTGTVTMECAFFGVPAVTLYKGSWLNYQIARHFITVKTFTMPNLLAGETVYPEFLQNDLTAHNLALAALDLLVNPGRRQEIKAQLARVISSLGKPGAADRAAEIILGLLE